MTLDEIASAAEQTLNFESAIQNQLEYQVLTGKEINIDAYQQAAASGDTAKAAEEMNRILEEQGDSIKGNFFAQEALAKTLGISREQMMKSLEFQKVQKKVGGDIAEIEKAINAEMANGLSLEEASAKVGEKSYDSIVAQNQSAQAFTRTIGEIKEAFTNALASSDGFKNLFNKENIEKYVKYITTELLPKAAAFGRTIGNLIDPKNIEKLVNKFNEIKDTLILAGKIVAGLAILKLAAGIKNLMGRQRGSSPMNPLYVTPTGGGMGGGGMDTGGPGGPSAPGSPGTTRGPKSKWKNRLSKAGRFGGAALGGYMLYNQLFGDGESMTGSEIGDTALGVASMAPMMAGGGGMNPPTPSGAAPATPQAKKMTSTAQQVSQLKAQNPGMTSQQALQQVRQTAPPKSKGFFSGLLEKTKDLGSSILKKTGISGMAETAKGFLQNPIVKGIGKALGPILSAVMGIMDIQSIISDAKMRLSAGEQVNTGQLGKQIVQSGADTVLKTILWAVPGAGQAIAAADLALGYLGFSPLRWATDHLVDLIPDNAFKDLGDLALGKQQQAQQVQDGSLDPNGGPVVSTFQKGELTPVMQGIKEDNVYMTTNKPVQQVQDGVYGRASQDNSAVLAAIKELAGVFAANSNKEITLEMNGQKVGKVLTPIMTNPLVRQMNIDSVLI